MVAVRCGAVRGGRAFPVSAAEQKIKLKPRTIYSRLANSGSPRADDGQWK